jgi:predicted MFS family arabinose efflux permease
MGFDIGIGLGAIALGVISQSFGWQVMWTVSAVSILLGLVGVWYSRPPRAQGE